MEKNNFLKETRGKRKEVLMPDLDFERLYYPRVSEVLGIQTNKTYENIAPDILEKACLRGTKVHEYCTSYAMGLWNPCAEQEYIPYVNAFIEWYETNVLETLYVATRLFDDQLKYTGEFDMIVVLKDSKRTALVDLKTSAGSCKSWAIQLAAYKHLCEINQLKVSNTLNVHLKKKGEQIQCSVKEYGTLEKEWQIFSSALNCYDYFHRKEVKNVAA